MAFEKDQAKPSPDIWLTPHQVNSEGILVPVMDRRGQKIRINNQESLVHAHTKDLRARLLESTAMMNFVSLEFFRKRF